MDRGIVGVAAKAYSTTRAAASSLAADDSDVMSVHLPPADARAFVHRTVQVLAAGRPPCPFCGEPLDPQGHLCPRRNGNLLH